jgi:hypothetical protein
MNANTPTIILAVVAGGLAIIGLIKPTWPLVPVAALLLAVAVVLLATAK